MAPVLPANGGWGNQEYCEYCEYCGSGIRSLCTIHAGCVGLRSTEASAIAGALCACASRPIRLIRPITGCGPAPIAKLRLQPIRMGGIPYFFSVAPAFLNSTLERIRSW